MATQRLLSPAARIRPIVACVTSGDLVSHIQIHMHSAQKAGATPEEIMEALNFVGSWIGVRRLLSLDAEALRSARQPRSRLRLSYRLSHFSRFALQLLSLCAGEASAVSGARYRSSR